MTTIIAAILLKMTIIMLAVL